MGFFDFLTAPLGAQFLYPLDTYGRPMGGRLDVAAGYGLSRKVTAAVGADAAMAAAHKIANHFGKPVAVPVVGQNKAVLVKPRGRMPGFAMRRPFVLPAMVRGPILDDLPMSFARGPLTDEQLRDIKAQERFVGRQVEGDDVDAPYKANTGEPVKRIEAYGPSTPNNAARAATLNVVRKAAGEGRALSSSDTSDAFRLFHFCFSFDAAR